MQISYHTEPEIGRFWWPDFRPGIPGQYAGSIDAPYGRCLASRLALLHEMAHALVYNVIGVTNEELGSNRNGLEAEASAIALAWIKPEHYAKARQYAITWLRGYSKRPVTLLNAAIRQVDNGWKDMS